MLDESAPPRPPGDSGAVDALQQLADGDDADRALLVADESLDRRTLALVRDEQVGVDQDGQGLSGGPTSSRMARTSSAKSRSTGGAVSSNSRKRAAPISRSVGGEITATGAPARVISISSPAATRFRTSEKRRAASVALRRATEGVYQINQINGNIERGAGHCDEAGQAGRKGESGREAAEPDRDRRVPHRRR